MCLWIQNFFSIAWSGLIIKGDLAIVVLVQGETILDEMAKFLRDDLFLLHLIALETHYKNKLQAPTKLHAVLIVCELLIIAT